MANKAKGSARKLDFGTLGGLLMAGFGLVGGLLLEGGQISDISQYTAAVIVLGGTLGAVLINTPMRVVSGAIRRMAEVFFEKALSIDSVIEQLIDYATKARKNGVVSLEGEANGVADPFLKKALNLAVDGTDLQEMRKMLELEISLEEHHAEAEARVFEVAGGYAPTIGIIGAVMGLIQVMKNLSDIDKVGHGIAVAFVATVYGVALANVLFLPMANKIKARAQQEAQLKELMVEGVTGIVEGMNPKLIRGKLEAYLPHSSAKGKGKSRPAE
jgi:chemotaxis protein MotA